MATLKISQEHLHIYSPELFSQGLSLLKSSRVSDIFQKRKKRQEKKRCSIYADQLLFIYFGIFWGVFRTICDLQHVIC